MDIVIFQQWKHWHTEAVDYAVRHSIGEFDRQTFLANIESIYRTTFKEGNIKSTFRKYSFILFRPAVVLRQITINKTILEDNAEPERRREKEYTSYIDPQRI